MPSLTARFTVLMAAALAALAPARAYALDAEVTSDTAAQFYDVRSPTGETVLMRRRLTTTLGVNAYDLLDAPLSDPKASELSLRARLRYDADYGASGDTTNTSVFNSFVPGYSQGLVDLMYAYIEGRRLFGGLLGFKIGRQYMTDVLGWWALDGGEVSVTTPFFVKLEAYGGFEERGSLPLSADRFDPEGVWRGSRGNFDPSLYPSFQPAAVAPAFGAAIESAGPTWIHGRLTYRRVYNTGQSDVSEFASSGLYSTAVYDGMRISSERVGYAMDTTWAGVGGLKGGVVYDLYRGEITHGYASLDGYLGNKVTLSGDFDYYVPWFDADSIWNYFAGQPSSDIGLRANVDVNRHLSIAGGGHVRLFTVQTEAFNPGYTAPIMYSPSPFSGTAAGKPFFPTDPHPADEGGNLSARWRSGSTTLGLRAAGNFSNTDTGGDRVGGDLSAEHVLDTRYILSGRAGVWQWDDKLRPDRNATTVNYVAGVGYRFAPRAQAMVEWEHDINRLVGQRFRLMASLNLAVTK